MYSMSMRMYVHTSGPRSYGRSSRKESEPHEVRSTYYTSTRVECRSSNPFPLSPSPTIKTTTTTTTIVIMSDEENCKELCKLCYNLYWKLGSLDDIQLWLDNNKDNEDLLTKAANYQDNNKETPLNYLVKGKPPADLVRRLLEFAPDTIKVQNTFGELPLHTALIYNASDDVINILCKVYPQATAVKKRQGDLPLHLALEQNASSHIIIMLLQAYPKAIEVQNKEERLPLHITLRCKASIDVFTMIFQAYPKAIEVPNKYGRLALHTALVHNASTDVFQMLLEAYPEAAELQSYKGCLPLHYACRYPMYCHKDFLNRLNLLVSAYPEGINVQDMDGKFPSCNLKLGVLESDYTEPLYLLHEAVKGGLSTHLIKLLIRAFPESCATKDNDGMVPLHHACASSASNFLQHVTVLLDANKDCLQIKDNHGRTPLKLLSNTASIPDEKGMLPLHHLTASSDSLTEQSLLFLVNAYSESIRTADKYGMLPFHHACLNQALSLEVLMILLNLYPEAVR
jgi:ankyrin repeat protein